MKKNDPRLAPILTVPEAAHLIEIPAPTLYDWLQPRKTRSPLIRGVTGPVRRGWPTLSIIALAEAHTAIALRRHKWSMPKLIEYVTQEGKDAEYPLAVPRLVTDGIDAFVEHDDELSRLWDLQIPFSEIVRPLLVELVPWKDDVTGAYRPRQLEPESQLVEMDPRFNSGRVSFTRNRVPLFATAGALIAGDTPADVAQDFRLDLSEVALVERNLDWFREAA